MDAILLELKCTDDRTMQELSSYRNLGTAAEFRRLKKQEMKRRKRRKLTSRIFNVVLTIAVYAFCLWIIASFIDVGLHNIHPNPVYQPWNFFTLIF